MYRNTKNKSWREKRERNLKILGFVSYQAYLRSELWKSIRQQKLASVGKCEICLVNKTQCVHHLDYSMNTLKGLKLHRLVCLCNECHKRVEFNSDGKKRGIEAVFDKTKTLLKKSGMWQSHLKDS